MVWRAIQTDLNRPGLPPTTDAVAARFLARDPAQRIATAQEGRALIADWVESAQPKAEAIGAHAPGHARQARTQPQLRVSATASAAAAARSRRRILVGAAAAVVLTAALGLDVVRRQGGSSSEPGPIKASPAVVSIPRAIPSAGTTLDASVAAASRLRKALDDFGAWSLLTQLRRSPRSSHSAAGASGAARTSAGGNPAPDADAAGRRIADRYRAGGIEGAAREFAPVRDVYFGSPEAPLAGKVGLYHDLCALSELERACQGRGIKCPTLAATLFSPRYGMETGPHLTNPRAVTVTFEKGSYAATLGKEASGPVLDVPGAQAGHLMALVDLRREPFEPFPETSPLREASVETKLLSEVDVIPGDLGKSASRETPFEVPLPADVGTALDAEIVAKARMLRAPGILRIFLRARDRGDIHLADLQLPFEGPEVVWHGLDPRLLIPRARLRVELLFFAEDRSKYNQEVHVRFVSIRWTPRNAR